MLQDLCNVARRSTDLDSFVKYWLSNEQLRAAFADLSAPAIYASPEIAWKTLRGIWIEWHDERNIVDINAAFAGLLLDGAAGHLAALGLGDIVLNNLGVELTAAAIERQLQRYGLSRATIARIEDLGERARKTTASWLSSVEREQLEPPIQRAQSDTLVEFAVDDQVSKVAFLIGTAGGGKSAALAQGLRKVAECGLSVLGFRLDRVDNFTTTEELGNKLGLSTSPVTALAATAAGAQCLLVVDQLDAVSLASGRMHNSFDAVADLVNEASAFPNMRVIFACRQFDVDNDHRIRNLTKSAKATRISVPPLTDHEVNDAVAAMGLDASQLQVHQRDLLRVPLHLVLLSTVADQPDALIFNTTAHLFDAYWDRKRQSVWRRKTDARFNEVINDVANAISDNQSLSVAETVLDRDALVNDAAILISEHVLVKERGMVAFIHEAFFDYAFARRESVLRPPGTDASFLLRSQLKADERSSGSSNSVACRQI